jgi:hypothetical protein
MFNGRRQPSCDGTSRMTRECQVRICERLGVKFPGPTRHVWTAPAVQEESDVSAKRSGAVMYPACFRLEDCLLRDAAAMAAGPDVIR